VVRKVSQQRIDKIADKHRLSKKQKSLLVAQLENPGLDAKNTLIAAGYSDMTAAKASKAVLGATRLRSAFAEIVDSGQYVGKITEFYDEVLAKPNEDIEVMKVKQAAIKELHKIQGDYAPQSSESKTLSAHIFPQIAFAKDSTNPKESIGAKEPEVYEGTIEPIDPTDPITPKE